MRVGGRRHELLEQRAAGRGGSGIPLQGVERALVDADAAVHAQRPVDGEPVQTLRVRSGVSAREVRIGSAWESIAMHQLGHSRAQIMQDVQAGSISLIVPCPAGGDGSITVGAAAPAADRAAATSSGSASGASGSRTPKTSPFGTPGGTSQRRPGDATDSPGSLAPGQARAAGRPAPRPCAAVCPRNPQRAGAGAGRHRRTPGRTARRTPARASRAGEEARCCDRAGARKLEPPAGLTGAVEVAQDEQHPQSAAADLVDRAEPVEDVAIRRRGRPPRATPQHQRRSPDLPASHWSTTALSAPAAAGNRARMRHRSNWSIPLVTAYQSQYGPPESRRRRTRPPSAAGSRRLPPRRPWRHRGCQPIGQRAGDDDHASGVAGGAVGTWTAPAAAASNSSAQQASRRRSRRGPVAVPVEPPLLSITRCSRQGSG